MKDTKEISLFDQVYNIPMDKIVKPLINMRDSIDKEKITELAEDIKENGLISPILVYEAKGKYVIIAGLRRFLAFVELDRTEIPAMIRNETTDNIFKLTFAENAQREDPSVMDEAVFIGLAIERLNLSQSEVARMIRKSASYVSERLAILDYQPELLAALENKEITFSVAREFNQIDDIGKMREYLRYAMTSGMTPRVARQWVADWKQSLKDAEHSERTDFVPTTKGVVRQTTVMYSCAICQRPYEIFDLTHLKVCRECMKIIDGVEIEAK